MVSFLDHLLLVCIIICFPFSSRLWFTFFSPLIANLHQEIYGATVISLPPCVYVYVCIGVRLVNHVLHKLFSRLNCRGTRNDSQSIVISYLTFHKQSYHTHFILRDMATRCLLEFLNQVSVITYQILFDLNEYMFY